MAKTYQEMKDALDKLGEKYRSTNDVDKRQKLSTEIGEAQQELQAFLSKGAKACPDGEDHKVIGMLKCPEHWDSNVGMMIPDVFEVGCLVCPPVLVKTKDGTTKRWSHSARGWSPKEAVEKWNGGDWLEDSKVDSVPSTKIFER